MNVLYLIKKVRLMEVLVDVLFLNVFIETLYRIMKSAVSNCNRQPNDVKVHIVSNFRISLPPACVGFWLSSIFYPEYG
jgi:hypothetical protein